MTPFTSTSPFADEPRVVAPTMRPRVAFVLETPFASESDGAVRAEHAFARELYESLEDPTFAEALEDLAEEIRAGLPPGNDGFHREAGEMALRHRLQPLVRASYAHLDRLAEIVGNRDVAAVEEHELDAAEAFVDEVDAPAFEQFFGALKRKLTKAVKGAVKAVKKGIKKGVQVVASVALGPIIGQLKKVVQPMLQRVLGWALDKLPPQYREVARTLAARFGVRVPAAAKAAPAISASNTQAVANTAANAPIVADANANAPAVADTSVNTPAVAPPSVQPEGTTATAIATSSDANAIAPAMSTTTPPSTASASGEPWVDPGDGTATANAASTQATTTTTATPPAVAPCVPTAEEIELELDARLTEMLVASETEADAIVARYEALEMSSHHDVADRAREALADELGRLREGEDPTPAIQGFLPALLPIIRTGIKLIGRKRVVDFIAGAIGTLIRPLVGPSVAPGLGQAIADLGLRTLVQAELGEAPAPAKVGNGALASTVEETVRMLSEQPDAVLESPALLEAALLEAFEVASASNMPPEALKPAARESTVAGVWVDRPARGPRMYRRFTHVFEVSLAPQSLAGVRTFGGRRLDQWLHDALGQAPSGALAARIHLFEVTPRTVLARIARAERALAPYRGRVRKLLHPLTVEAAGVLLQQPKLGRGTTVPADRQLGPGQRLYFIELDRPFSSSFAPRVFALVEGNTGPRAELRLSEALAQRLAVAVRERKSAGQLIHRLRQSLRGIAVPLWVWSSLAAWLQQRAQDLVGASEQPEDGITIMVRRPAAGTAATADLVTLSSGLAARA